VDDLSRVFRLKGELRFKYGDHPSFAGVDMDDSA